jgi:hypothetical protein
LVKADHIHPLYHPCKVNVRGHVVVVNILSLKAVPLRIGDEDYFAEGALGIDHFFVLNFGDSIHIALGVAPGFGSNLSGSRIYKELILICPHR